MPISDNYLKELNEYMKEQFNRYETAKKKYTEEIDQVCCPQTYFLSIF